MVEYDFEKVSDFWERVYCECEKRGVVIEYAGREGSKGEGDFGNFVKVVEDIILEFCKVRY